MTKIDEEQFDQLSNKLDRVGGQITLLTQACDSIGGSLMGIQEAIRDQIEAISMLADKIVLPMKQMQADLSEIRDGVDDMR